jgi:hypothetical protein
VTPRLAGPSGSKVARLALVAMNAVRNGDLHRAVEALQTIHDEAMSGAVSPHDDLAADPADRGERA